MFYILLYFSFIIFFIKINNGSDRPPPYKSIFAKKFRTLSLHEAQSRDVQAKLCENYINSNIKYYKVSVQHTYRAKRGEFGKLPATRGASNLGLTEPASMFSFYPMPFR